MQGRTYAHSYHVCKFQGSSAFSVGGDSGQDGRTDGRTDGGDNHNIPTFFSKSVGIINNVKGFIGHAQAILNPRIYMHISPLMQKNTMC